MIKVGSPLAAKRYSFVTEVLLYLAIFAGIFTVGAAIGGVWSLALGALAVVIVLGVIVWQRSKAVPLVEIKDDMSGHIDGGF